MCLTRIYFGTQLFSFDKKYYSKKNHTESKQYLKIPVYQYMTLVYFTLTCWNVWSYGNHLTTSLTKYRYSNFDCWRWLPIKLIKYFKLHLLTSISPNPKSCNIRSTTSHTEITSDNSKPHAPKLSSMNLLSYSVASVQPVTAFYLVLDEHADGADVRALYLTLCWNSHFQYPV